MRAVASPAARGFTDVNPKLLIWREILLSNVILFVSKLSANFSLENYFCHFKNVCLPLKPRFLFLGEQTYYSCSGMTGRSRAGSRRPPTARRRTAPSRTARRAARRWVQGPYCLCQGPQLTNKQHPGPGTDTYAWCGGSRARAACSRARSWPASSTQAQVFVVLGPRPVLPVPGLAADQQAAPRPRYKLEWWVKGPSWLL